MTDQDDLKITKDFIQQLVAQGNDLMEKADKETNIHAAEKLAKRGTGYHAAVSALLFHHVELYNDLIEDPALTKLRKATRSWGL